MYLARLGTHARDAIFLSRLLFPLAPTAGLPLEPYGVLRLHG